MRIAIVGLGAVGGLVAARLATTAHAVCALARGGTLAAVRSRGLRLTRSGGTATHTVRVSDDAAALGPQDAVIVAVKAQSLPALAPRLQPLLHAGTAIVPAMNGVPWWFMQAWPARPPGMALHLASVDPDNQLPQALPLRQLVGCVVHLAARCPAPGHVVHTMGDRLILGAPAGSQADAAPICAALREAGLTVQTSADIRRDLWFKLWGNMTMNPVSALTGATGDRILDDPLVNAFCARVMAEAAAVGARVGCPIDQTPADRMAVTRQLGAFKTSMLQDVEAGRSLELGALLGAVVELARAASVETPYTDALLGLTRLMAATRGLARA